MIPHDLRRSLIKLLDEGGELSRDEIKAITGHKTDSVFARYNIHDRRRVARVGARMGKLADSI